MQGEQAAHVVGATLGVFATRNSGDPDLLRGQVARFSNVGFGADGRKGRKRRRHLHSSQRPSCPQEHKHPSGNTARASARIYLRRRHAVRQTTTAQREEPRTPFATLRIQRAGRAA